MSWSNYCNRRALDMDLNPYWILALDKIWFWNKSKEWVLICHDKMYDQYIICLVFKSPVWSHYSVWAGANPGVENLSKCVWPVDPKVGPGSANINIYLLYYTHESCLNLIESEILCFTVLHCSVLIVNSVDTADFKLQ